MSPTTKVRRPAALRRATLSDQLRGIIKTRGLTPYAVAQSARVAPSVVSRFINGERGLSTETWDKVADALGLELKETRRGRITGTARPGTRPGQSGEGGL
jgi:hypothetical protein